VSRRVRRERRLTTITLPDPEDTRGHRATVCPQAQARATNYAGHKQDPRQFSATVP